MNKSLFSMAATGLLMIPTVVAAQSVRFEVIPGTAAATDLSPDGRFLVGLTDQNLDGLPDGSFHLDFLTDIYTILPAPGLEASAVSDDGSIVLGCMAHPTDGEVAAMWTQADGWTSLGFLENAGTCPSRSNGYELSADGSVATGLSWDGCSGRGFVWSEATGMQELDVQSTGGNRGSVISADGTIVGGFAQGSFNRTPARWDATTLDGMLLDPPNGDIVGEITGISDDGTKLLGAWDGEAIVWTTDDGAEPVGAGSVFPTWNGYAMDIADNGTIVGFDVLFQSRLAWIKPRNKSDLVSLATYVTDHGGTIPPGVGLGISSRISADGTTIVGHTFFQSAWMVTICYGDVNWDFEVDVDDLVAVITAWGDNPDHPADFDNDDMVDVDDLVEVIINWGDCP